MAKQKRENQFAIEGQIINRKNQKGIPRLRVEAWDKDLVCDDLLGTAQTDESGWFFLNFDEKYYNEICFDRKPDIYFKVFQEQALIHSTENSVLWNVSREKKTIVMEVTLPTPENNSHTTSTALSATPGNNPFPTSWSALTTAICVAKLSSANASPAKTANTKYPGHTAA